MFGDTKSAVEDAPCRNHVLDLSSVVNAGGAEGSGVGRFFGRIIVFHDGDDSAEILGFDERIDRRERPDHGARRREDSLERFGPAAIHDLVFREALYEEHLRFLRPRQGFTIGIERDGEVDIALWEDIVAVVGLFVG